MATTLRSSPNLYSLAASSLVVLAITAFGCSKETPSAEQPRAPATQAEAKTAEPVADTKPAALSDKPDQPAAEPAGEGTAEAEGATPAKAQISESNFDLGFAVKGPYKAGKAAEVMLTLEAKGEFKVNDKYPYKLKLSKSDGVKFPADVVKKDAVKLEKKKAVMTVAFTPEQAGTKKIAGQFSFSICTSDKCLIEKRDVSVDVSVE